MLRILGCYPFKSIVRITSEKDKGKCQNDRVPPNDKVGDRFPSAFYFFPHDR